MNREVRVRGSRQLFAIFVLASAFWLAGAWQTYSQELKTSWSIPDLMTFTVMPEQRLLYGRFAQPLPNPGSVYNGNYIELVYSQYGDLLSSNTAENMVMGYECMMSADKRGNLFTWGSYIAHWHYSSRFFSSRPANVGQPSWFTDSLLGGSPIPRLHKYAVSADASSNIYFVSQESRLVKLDSWANVQWKTNLPYAKCVASDDDGNSYVAGNSADFGAQSLVLAKYNTSGELQWETQWGGSSNDSVCAIAVSDADAIYVLGSTYGAFDGQTNGGSADVFLSRFTSDGTRLWSRILGGASADSAGGIAIQTNKNVYVCGSFDASTTPNSPRWTPRIISFDTNGTRKVLVDGRRDVNGFRNIEIDSDGAVYVSDGRTIDKMTAGESSIGGTISYGGTRKGEVLIVVSTDPQFGHVSFSTRMPAPGAYSLTNLPAGRFYVAAVLTKPGKAFEHVSLIDPWGVYASGGSTTAAPIYLAVGSATTSVDIALSESRNPFGRSMIPLDFDGDGKSDLGVLRPSTVTWYIAAQGGIGQPFQFGTFGDKPIAADYDGDGLSDQAVFRPSTATWYLGSSMYHPPPPFQFGAFGDIPIPADYDGDVFADIAVFRPSTMQWFIFGSSAGPMPVYVFGAPGDIPIPADYDGDGKADFAVLRPSTMTWYIFGTSRGPFTPFQYGGYGDLPVPGDYDGDGICDYAVFRPSNNMWFFWCSTLGGSFGPHQFGAIGDIPLR